MSQKPTGADQHIVPQQMIRNFAGADGRLIEMIKPDLQFATRRRPPKAILFADHFYHDAVSDFDAEFLTPIEQRFREVYPKVVAGTPLTNGDDGAAFIDWVAAMLIRTRLVSAMVPAVLAGLPEQATATPDRAKNVLANLIRSEWFVMYQDLFAREGWHWKRRLFDDPCLVLSDHPVGMTSLFHEGGQMVVVPLSSTVVLIGGAPAAIAKMEHATDVEINTFVTAYAARSIFAADLPPLQRVKKALMDDSLFPPEWAAAARQPLFGAPQRLAERMKSAPLGPNFDSGAAIKVHAETFGRYRWETKSEA